MKYKIVWRRVKVKRKKGNRVEFLRYKNEAMELAKNRITYFNTFYQFKVNKITIKNQKSRWGSCSKKGNLNFNYKIALLPQKLSDYVILHELCHLGEFNHSPHFWNIVAKSMPNYRAIRKQFKKVIL
ncbi:MAG: hypothetical protein A3D44_02185 [Candidatus Staskawiczbacteria bacterium RIFCSPHIGHO2_02_FULL_42_22]|uniref:YgjP-like metallopeptidase domain-containing protein n=1 Tax=Candidatus Staskawiczbacteria bacterium RIFCSPHIGHO2_02_FULL_42_22 TaxID=1802207 RepID=A0A1G2I1U0_9BACT|nr:MAG: hypothetical protein A3D44_02185 [Candidatus Staskawiczbacteria bacterium RIFCSPHIGHO2_02_FULL_42_22]